jgi:hypothetical protein
MRVKEAIPPQDAAFEAALAALQLERHLALRTGPPAFLAVWHEAMPTGVAAGEALHRSGEMQRLAARGVAAQEALGVLQQASAQAARAVRGEVR